MVYCCHVWAGAPSCYLELLDKRQEQICRTVGPSLAASVERLVHCRNLASLSMVLLYMITRSCFDIIKWGQASLWKGLANSLWVRQERASASCKEQKNLSV